MMYRPDNSAFDYVNNRFNIWGAVKYAINWKNGRHVKVHLVPWLEGQVGEAIETQYFAEAQRKILQRVKRQDDYDFIVMEALRYVRSIIKYVGDTKTWGVAEYWQTAKETFDLRTGDCEDGMVLLYVLCRVCGVPSNRLPATAGSVVSGGHAWLSYRPMYSPIHFVHLDWCYWYSSLSINAREWYFVKNNKIYSLDTNKPDNKYKKAWWYFNENQGYFYVNARNVS